MPIKWTPETDQILLLKILETSDVSPRCALIAENWPTGRERPTPRAISERIFKIRANAKASGTASHFSVPSTPRKKSTTSATRKTNGSKGGAGKGKRKRGGMLSDEEGASDDSESDGFKSDNTGSDASDVKFLHKKAKVNSIGEGKGKHPAKVKMEEVENGALYDNSHEIDEDGATEVVDFA